MRQLNQFGYDLDRLQFVAKDEVELLSRVREDYDQFIKVVTQVVELIRAAKVAQGREVQLVQAGPLADRLERLTNELVNKAEADMVASIDATHEAYVGSRWVVIGFAVGSIALALSLGYAISWSLIGPVRHMVSGQWVNGPHPERENYQSFADFADPDGNIWLLQEVDRSKG